MNMLFNYTVICQLSYIPGSYHTVQYLILNCVWGLSGICSEKDFVFNVDE